MVRAPLRAALTPTVNGMMTVGVVQLPGMMTGQILAGSSPLVTIRYQIVVAFILAAATTLGSLLFVRLAADRSSTPPTSSAATCSDCPPDAAVERRALALRTDLPVLTRRRGGAAGRNRAVSPRRSSLGHNSLKAETRHRFIPVPPPAMTQRGVTARAAMPPPCPPARKRRALRIPRPCQCMWSSILNHRATRVPPGLCTPAPCRRRPAARPDRSTAARIAWRSAGM